MSGPVGAKTKRVGGKTTGENASFKRDGYAAGGPPMFTRGTKPGMTRGRNARGYSGPPVQTGSHPGAPGSGDS